MFPTKPSTIYHVVIFIHHVISATVVTQIDVTGSNDQLVIESAKFRWRFITTWNMLIQVIYFTYVVINDYRIHLGKKGSTWDKLEKFSEKYLTCLLIPIGVFVSITFWGFYHYDRQTIFPVSMEYVCPPWLNHCVHTNIMFVGYGELLFSRKGFSLPSLLTGFIYVNIFYWVYMAQFVHAAYQYNQWIYFIYNVVTPLVKLGLIMIKWVFMVVCFLISYQTQRWVIRYKQKVE